MLIVTVELVPGGTGPRKTIGSLRIANASDLADVSDYAVFAMEAANPLAGTPARTAEATLQAHDRHQSVWMILEAVAKAVEGADWVDL
ncbi:hypothetical protein BDS110ZK4_30260 [Bradyrhizobium diazoefficiens]|uniref:Uncharacterized protein n=1 Tax=Bradyrhizobium diazoefficiens TaxID=1355477 RepID=A0A809Z6F1_9BRAD|nr:hypothetical protein XF4B_45010 [Bradyrhizobium diazoefficiens]BCE91668.1 hypothetical protein XF10B_44660 [Bradyrhizobium diazoefficiens]